MSNKTYKPLRWVALAALLVVPVHPPDLEAAVNSVEPKIVAWRRDIHQHPELSNREMRTAKQVAVDYLTSGS